MCWHAEPDTSSHFPATFGIWGIVVTVTKAFAGNPVHRSSLGFFLDLIQTYVLID